EESPSGFWGALVSLFRGPRAGSRSRYPLIDVGPQAADYVYSGQKWPGSDPMGEDYLVNPANNDGLGAMAVLNAVTSAAGTWSSVSTADFEFSYGTTTGATTHGYNNANEILWRNVGASSTLATSYWWYNYSDFILEADVVFNDYHAWTTSGPGGYDIETVALHELGHWLSLDHSNNPSAIMYATYGGVQHLLHQDDIDGISWIYPGEPGPTNTPTSTPTNTPPSEPSNTPTPTKTPTATATPTATPTDTPTATSTPTPSPTSTPTSTPTNTPGSTPTDTPTPTATSTPTPSPTSTGTPTDTPTNTSTSAPTSTRTDTPTPSHTPDHGVFLPLVLRQT
ncbi:MAG: matrixin family metalloprotease, partial [Anaerolineae bacterium]